MESSVEVEFLGAFSGVAHVEDLHDDIGNVYLFGGVRSLDRGELELLYVIVVADDFVVNSVLESLVVRLGSSELIAGPLSHGRNTELLI